MSQENLETLRDGFAWFRESGKSPAHLATDDFVWDMSHFDGWPEQPTYEGIEGANDFLAEWGGAWDDWVVGVQEMHEAGEKVVAIVRQTGRSKLTGTSTEMLIAMVWSFRGGK